MALAIVSPLETLRDRSDYETANSVAVAVCENDAGSDVTATGSDPENCWTHEEGRAGAPLVTDGSTASIWLRATHTKSAGSHFCMVADLPEGSTVKLYSTKIADPTFLQMTAGRVMPSRAWFAYATSDLGHSLANLWINIVLPSAQAIEVKFVGFGGDTGPAGRLNEPGFSNNRPAILAGFDMPTIDNSLRVGPGPTGATWKVAQPSSYELHVTLSGSVDDSLYESIYEVLERAQRRAWPVLVILNGDDPGMPGGAAVGFVRALSPFGTGGTAVRFPITFELEQMR